MAIKNEGAARGAMWARDEEKNDGTDISIVIILRRLNQFGDFLIVR